MYDAIIVGAGPTGNYIALRLARLGRKVAVVERRPSIGGDVCCTGIIGKECLQKFPIFDGTIVARASAARFFSPSGKQLRMAKDDPQAYVIDRPAFDVIQAQKAEQAGAEYLLGAEARNITKSSQLARVEINRSGVDQIVDGKVAVVCSGFASRLTHRLGMGKAGDFVPGAEANVRLKRALEVEVHLGDEVAPGFFAWLVPTSPGTGLVGLLSRRAPAVHLQRFLSKLVQENKVECATSKVRYGAIPLSIPSHTFRERMLVVGDAAGHVKPTTGGGIYYGLLCADIAVDTIIGALDCDDFSARRLGAYEKAWKHRLGRELRIGHYARKLYERLSDRQIEEIFDIIESNRIHETLLSSEGFSFDWHSGLILEALKNKAFRQALLVVGKSFLPFYR